ncbi:hypothetical protein ACJX0J_015712, partial [Zea mays]
YECPVYFLGPWVDRSGLCVVASAGVRIVQIMHYVLLNIPCAQPMFGKKSIQDSLLLLYYYICEVYRKGYKYYLPFYYIFIFMNQGGIVTVIYIGGISIYGVLMQKIELSKAKQLKTKSQLDLKKVRTQEPFLKVDTNILL